VGRIGALWASAPRALVMSPEARSPTFSPLASAARRYRRTSHRRYLWDSIANDVSADARAVASVRPGISHPTIRPQNDAAIPPWREDNARDYDQRIGELSAALSDAHEHAAHLAKQVEALTFFVMSAEAAQRGGRPRQEALFDVEASATTDEDDREAAPPQRAEVAMRLAMAQMDALSTILTYAEKFDLPPRTVDQIVHDVQELVAQMTSTTTTMLAQLAINREGVVIDSGETAETMPSGRRGRG
jgi:hypothetical protein